MNIYPNTWVKRSGCFPSVPKPIALPIKNGRIPVAHYFADGYPYLITSMESLAYINEKIMNPVEAIPMDRFRSNIVIEGWAEAFKSIASKASHW